DGVDASLERRPGTVAAENSIGRARATPLDDAADGPLPTQAVSRAVSPFKNRCARTPPVARPLAGYSDNGVSLALMVPAVPPDDTVTTSASTVSCTAAKKTTDAPAASFIPATPA